MEKPQPGIRGELVHAEPVGLATIEVYRNDQGPYCVFLVGDHLAVYLGAAVSLEDCQAEIEALKELAGSEEFQRAVSM